MAGAFVATAGSQQTIVSAADLGKSQISLQPMAYRDGRGLKKARARAIHAGDLPVSRTGSINHIAYLDHAMVRVFILFVCGNMVPSLS
jgi:hypothetical protein